MRTPFHHMNSSLAGKEHPDDRQSDRNTLHVSDYDGIDEKHWLPGQGIVNWPEVIQALIETGYDGPFMMEVNFRTADELVNSFRTIIQAHADKYTG